ncbi:MAG TPA: molybdopterin-dependent oxidoreductase [Burkholderiales bacterium]|nr:molybdopterin-dependent oxidoreductase [Burkholderiales bacterium]
MRDRRGFLRTAGGLALAGASGMLAARYALAGELGPAGLPQGTLESSRLESLPGKVPLIKKSWRPPNFETPVRYFEQAFTPNDAFFVRYHLSNIPRVDAASWRLAIAGDAVERPFELTLEQLKREFEIVELPAVCQCSGNRRGLSDPHVPGVEWGYGAMGNALWRGVRLKDVLARARVRKEALEVVFDGADSGVNTATPDFRKSIPVWKALEESTLLAFEMNAQPLPHWNGYPVRLVVAGWTATYWMKHLAAVTVQTQPLKSFWMNPAYRIPKGKFPLVDRFTTQENETSTPITEMVVNSLITNLDRGATARVNDTVEVRGIAWDGGYGIAWVEVSHDGGETWRSAELDRDLGRYAWRQWRYRFQAQMPGTYTVMARASNRVGATQSFDLIFNPAGYHNNVVQRIDVTVS